MPGRKSAVVIADVTQIDQVKAMIQEVVQKLGTVDISIQNAGIVQVRSLLDSSYEDRKRMLDVNCHGVYNVAIEAARQMIKQGHGGRIISASSIAGLKPFENTVYYGNTKALVRGFTQGAAQEWAAHGILCNAYGSYSL
jgi:meso-butanediol dehydrogenase/(S,S)-butanediol dehydrogenase/diacetyl reductase